jgi:hypothetical protein
MVKTSLHSSTANNDNEYHFILKALHKQNRQLTLKELYNLKYRSRMIKIRYSEPYKTTNKTVYHYFINDALEGLKNGY